MFSFNQWIVFEKILGCSLLLILWINYYQIPLSLKILVKFYSCSHSWYGIHHHQAYLSTKLAPHNWLTKDWLPINYVSNKIRACFIGCMATDKLKDWQAPCLTNVTWGSKTLHRDHFVYAPSQWETTLQCNVVSHWLGACCLLSTKPFMDPLNIWTIGKKLKWMVNKIFCHENLFCKCCLENVCYLVQIWMHQETKWLKLHILFKISPILSNHFSKTYSQQGIGWKCEFKIWHISSLSRYRAVRNMVLYSTLLWWSSSNIFFSLAIMISK